MSTGGTLLDDRNTPLDWLVVMHVVEVDNRVSGGEATYSCTYCTWLDFREWMLGCLPYVDSLRVKIMCSYLNRDSIL